MNDKPSVLNRLQVEKNRPGSSTAAERREAWQRSLSDLIRQVRGWTAEAERSGLLTILEKPVRLHEALIGEYDVTRLDLTTPAGYTISLKPIATYVLGADGRVDLQGPLNDRKLIWRRDTGKWWIADHLGEEHWALGELAEDQFWAALNQMLPPDPPAEGSDAG